MIGDNYHQIQIGAPREDEEETILLSPKKLAGAFFGGCRPDAPNLRVLVV
jgi:hypothetical protein